MSQVYNAWGFRANPFAQTPLPASEEGQELLVGRDAEVDQIMLRLGSPPKWVTVEGRNGIGKTSVINVAAFKARMAFLDAPATRPLLVPCDQPFQLDPEADPDVFITRVLHKVILVLKTFEGDLSRAGRKSAKLAPLYNWISKAMYSSGNVGGGAFGFGVSAGKATAATNSSGFVMTGFEQQAKEVLSELFPGGQGGVVCIIDNLELMKTSKAARDLIESLRDRLLSAEGLRWVLSGAAGIVRGIGSTPRLSGYLHDPVDIGEIAAGLAAEILQRRQTAFAVNVGATLPISPQDFQTLFDILAGNIRDALSEADNFCTAIFAKGDWKAGSSPDAAAFKEWLRAQAGRRQEAAERVVTERPWKLFDDVILSGGQCAPGDFANFEFETPQAMRSNVLKLEEANLIQSLRDEDDNRRKTILITSNGWMVHFARSRGIDRLFNIAKPAN
jgi:hypothetical protein